MKPTVKITDRLRDSIALIAPREFAERNPWAVVRGEKRDILVRVVPNDHPDANLKPGYYATKKLISITGTILEILDMGRRLFVYGTLLSKHWFGNQVYSSWLPPSKYSARALIRNFKLYPIGPCAVKEGDDYIIGELYFRVPRKNEERIDDVELGCGYDKVTVEVEVVENTVLPSKVEAPLYACRSSCGESVRSMLYGEAFKTPTGTFFWDYGEYFDVLRGNAGIVISAPHGGYMRIGEKIKDAEADEETYELSRLMTIEIYELSGRGEVPKCILARLHRSRADFNRKPEINGPWAGVVKEYRNVLLGLLKDSKLFVDIHGMGSMEVDIILGTLRGKSAEPWLISELRNSLERFFSVEVDGIFPGGELTRFAAKITNAFQLELSRKLRRLDKLNETARKLAKAIWEVYGKLEN